MNHGQQLIEKALSSRLELRQKFEALRLIDGQADGLPGLYLDCFGKVAIAHAHSQVSGSDRSRGDTTNSNIDYYWQLLKDQHSICEELFNIQSIYFRHHSGAGKSAPASLISGTNVKELVVTENQVKFLIKPEEQLQGGLFLDTREIRIELAKISAGKKLLNLFCYTGSLGVVAAHYGASKVTQVDISKAILNWARENAALNQGAENIIYRPDDCRVFLEREVRRVAAGKEPYQIIVLDPPAFSNSAKGAMSLKRDFSELIKPCLQILARGGIFYCLCNLRELSAAEIANLIDKELKLLKLTGSKQEITAAKPDFKLTGDLSSVVRGIKFKLL